MRTLVMMMATPKLKMTTACVRVSRVTESGAGGPEGRITAWAPGQWDPPPLPPPPPLAPPPAPPQDPGPGPGSAPMSQRPPGPHGYGHLQHRSREELAGTKRWNGIIEKL